MDSAELLRVAARLLGRTEEAVGPVRVREDGSLSALDAKGAHAVFPAEAVAAAREAIRRGRRGSPGKERP